MANIYVAPFFNGFGWFKGVYEEIHVSTYEITESDFRSKTASFTSNIELSIEDNDYAVCIVSDKHETFAGLIISKSDKDDGLFEYKCHDWARLFMSKINYTANRYIHQHIRALTNNSVKLYPLNQYSEAWAGGVTNINEMKNTKMNIQTNHDKTIIDMIKGLVYGKRMNAQVLFGSNGDMSIVPFRWLEWMESRVNLRYLIDYTVDFNVTDLITSVNGLTFKEIFNADKDYLRPSNGFTRVIRTETNIDINGNKSKAPNKPSEKVTKSDNVYKTKKKAVWVNMDNCWGSSADNKYFRTFCKELEKLGWKVHRVGVGSQLHTNDRLASKCKDGVWLTLDNGVDCQVFRHLGHDTWFKSILLKNNARAAFGFIAGAGEIRKGGAYFKYLGVPHDGVSGAGGGLRYPAGYLADCGVPFFYSKGNHPRQAARLFNNGGDSKLALSNSYKKRLKDWHANWNWSKKY